MRLGLPDFSSSRHNVTFKSAGPLPLNLYDQRNPSSSALNSSSLILSPSSIPTPAFVPYANNSGADVRYQFPVAALSLFDVVFLIAFIPIMDCIQRHLDKTGAALLE